MQTMKDVCGNCELRGYSRELCAVHMRHCHKNPEPRELAAPIKIGGKMLGGMALGITAGMLATTAASFVGGLAVLKSLGMKLLVSGGALGGGIGLAKGVKRSHQRQASFEEKKMVRVISTRSTSRRLVRLYSTSGTARSRE